MLQQSPAPRFSRTPAADIAPPRVPGEDTAAVLADYGLSAEEIATLTSNGVVAG
jgi:alpha-methylacyl-CoA racemase